MTDTVIPGHSCFLLCELPSSISSLLHHACLCCCNKLRPSNMILGPCFLKICSANLFFFFNWRIKHLHSKAIIENEDSFCVLNIATSFVYSLFLPFFLFVTFVVCCAGEICVSAIHGYSHLTCVYGGSYDPLVGKDFSKHFLEGWSSGDEFFPFLLVPHF